FQARWRGPGLCPAGAPGAPSAPTRRRSAAVSVVVAVRTNEIMNVYTYSQDLRKRAHRLQIILVVGTQRLDSLPSRSLEQRIADPRLGYHCLEGEPPGPVRPSLPMLRPRLSEAEPRLQRLDPLAPDPRHFPRL